MADRTTKVRLTAEVNNYVSGMERAAKATRDMADGSAAKLAQQREAFETVGRSALAIGVVAAAGVALAIKKFADFDAAMSNVQAATQESESNMRLLRDAAIEAGGSTVFTAVEAANAVEELGKAGLSTAEILEGGLAASLSLAAAGQLDVARAAEITAITMKQFGLEGRDATRLSDLLAAGAGKAAGDVEDLAQALNQAALVANQTGLSVEETTGVLSAFASAGLLGSDAGTSFKSMLQRLTPQSAEAQRELDRLGISAYDSQGAFIGAAAFAGELQTGLKELTTQERNAALATIFGSDAVRAASVLYEQGADGIQSWIDATNDSGYAARVAADRMNNLAGDIEKLGGAFDSALIKTGSGANDVLRAVVQSVTFLVDSVGSLPTPVLNGALAVGALGAAVALTGGAAALAVPKFVDFKNSLAVLKVSASGAAGAIGLVGGAVGVATVVLGAFIAEQAASRSRTDAFAESLDQATGAVTDYTRELVVKRLEEKGAFEDAEKYGITQKELTDAVLDGGDALALVEAKLAGTGEELSLNERRLSGVSREWGVTGTAIRGTRAELEGAAEAQANSAAAGVDNAEALAAVESAADDAEQAVKDLKDALLNFGQVQLDARSAARQFESAVDDAAAAVAENGVTLDIATEAGRRNQESLDAIAEAANAHAAAVYEETGSMEAVSAALATGRQQYIDTGIAMGLSRDEAIKYADALIATPEAVTTQVTLSGVAESEARIAKFYADWNNKPVTVKFFADTFGLTRGAAADAARLTAQAAAGSANGNLFAYADGGIAEGIYSGGTPLYKFAEPETRWEAFISGKPGQEDRNRKIWAETGQRLGVMLPASPAAGMSAGVSSTRETNITVNAETSDPSVVAELVLQQISARLVTAG